MIGVVRLAIRPCHTPSHLPEHWRKKNRMKRLVFCRLFFVPSHFRYAFLSPWRTCYLPPSHFGQSHDYYRFDVHFINSLQYKFFERKKNNRLSYDLIECEGGRVHSNCVIISSSHNSVVKAPGGQNFLFFRLRFAKLSLSHCSGAHKSTLNSHFHSQYWILFCHFYLLPIVFLTPFRWC